MVTSKRTYAKTHIPGLLLPMPWTPQWATANPCSAGDPQTLIGKFVSCGLTGPFPWVLVHTRFCWCPQEWTLFPTVLWESFNEIPLAFRCPGDSQSLCQIPRLGSMMWGLEPSQQCENFFGIIVIQWVGCPPHRFGIWFCHDCVPPTILLLCPWILGIFFWWVLVSSGWWLFNSCDFGDLTGGADHKSFYITIFKREKMLCS